MNINYDTIWPANDLKKLLIGFQEQDADSVVYLDNASTTPRFSAASFAQYEYEKRLMGNPNRGAHKFAAKSSSLFESSRETIASFLGVTSKDVAFVSSATEAANLLAFSFENLTSRDVIYCTEMEHHSNFLPWKKMAKNAGVVFKVIPVLEGGILDIEWFDENVVEDKPKIIAITAMSNVTGFCPCIEYFSKKAKEVNVDNLVIVDAAQIVSHKRSNGLLWGGDIAFFSGHKMNSVSGIGVIAVKDPVIWSKMGYGKLGGGIVKSFTGEEFKLFGGYKKFESGSPNVAGAIAMAEASKIFSGWDWNLLEAHKSYLSRYMSEKLKSISGVSIIGRDLPAHGIVSFNAEWGHSHDLGTVLDASNIMVRVGHHCAIPYLQAMKAENCVRASVGFYNTKEDIDCLIAAVLKAKEILNG